MTVSVPTRRVASPARFLLTLLLAVSLAGVAAPSAFAQAGLEVYAVDVQAGEPVEGARIHVVNEDIGYESVRPTNRNGKVQWPGLSTSGRYDVYVEETDQYYEARATGVSSAPARRACAKAASARSGRKLIRGKTAVA